MRKTLVVRKIKGRRTEQRKLKWEGCCVALGEEEVLPDDWKFQLKRSGRTADQEVPGFTSDQDIWNEFPF